MHSKDNSNKILKTVYITIRHCYNLTQWNLHQPFSNQSWKPPAAIYLYVYSIQGPTAHSQWAHTLAPKTTHWLAVVILPNVWAGVYYSTSKTTHYPYLKLSGLIVNKCICNIIVMCTLSTNYRPKSVYTILRLTVLGINNLCHLIPNVSIQYSFNIKYMICTWHIAELNCWNLASDCFIYLNIPHDIYNIHTLCRYVSVYACMHDMPCQIKLIL